MKPIKQETASLPHAVRGWQGDRKLLARLERSDTGGELRQQLV